MSYPDDVARIIRYFRRRMEEIESLAMSAISDLLEYPSPGDLATKARMLRDGAIEPLVSVFDEGEYLLIAVNLPGAARDSIEVRLYTDRVEIRAILQEETVRRALGSLYWSRGLREYRGSFKLPAPIDPSTAEKEVRGDILLIRARKLIQS